MDQSSRCFSHFCKVVGRGGGEGGAGGGRRVLTSQIIKCQVAQEQRGKGYGRRQNRALKIRVSDTPLSQPSVKWMSKLFYVRNWFKPALKNLLVKKTTTTLRKSNPKAPQSIMLISMQQMHANSSSHPNLNPRNTPLRPVLLFCNLGWLPDHSFVRDEYLVHCQVFLT